MGNDSEIFAKIARWTGFISAFFVFVLGVVHVVDRGATVSWPSHFTDDVNAKTWRLQLFTFIPDVFLDVWTPTLFGLAGSLVHLRGFKSDLICQDFTRFFLFNLIMGLFASIGYVGGLGIIFSIPIWITCLFCIVAHFVAPGRADLTFKIGMSVSEVKHGKVVSLS